MNCIAASSFTIHNLWAALGCVAVHWLLTWWSVRGLRQGKPAIPKHILILTPLAVYLVFLQFSLPTVTPPATTERGSRLESYAETNHALRRDLDYALRDLERLNDVTRALMNLAWLAALIVISNWLALRMDDRNWIHGGIRPPPGHEPPDTH